LQSISFAPMHLGCTVKYGCSATVRTCPLGLLIDDVEQQSLT